MSATTKHNPNQFAVFFKRKSRNMKSVITREGIYFLFVVLVILIGSLIREINPMLLLSAFLCAPLFIAWRMGRRSLKKIRIRRRLPNQVFAGEPFIVHLEANNENRKRWFSFSCWGLVVADRIRPVREHEDENSQAEEKPYEPAVYFEYIRNGKSVRKSYAGRIPQRGRYRVGPFLVQTRFPFGFFRHWFEQTTKEAERDEFCVYPKLGRISSRWQARQHEAVESQQRRRFRPSRITGEFLAVRRWQRGDAKRWIHWRASARHGEPFVRQFEKNQNRDSAILIDLYQNPNETISDDLRQRENFELAISFTATLVSEATKRGGCDLFFAASRPNEDYLAGPVSLPLVENILHRLALAEPDSNDSLGKTLIKSLSQIDPSADLILVTPHSINLTTSSRFDAVRNDPRFRVVLQRLRIVNTSDPALGEFFSMEDF